MTNTVDEAEKIKTRQVNELMLQQKKKDKLIKTMEFIGSNLQKRSRKNK